MKRFITTRSSSIEFYFSYLSFVLVGLILVSCASSGDFYRRYRMYPGPLLPLEKVAVLNFAHNVFIISINGWKIEDIPDKPPYKPKCQIIELLPDLYKLEVAFYSSITSAYHKSWNPLFLEFHAKPGGYYFVVGNPDIKAKKWKPEIKDTTDLRIRDLKYDKKYENIRRTMKIIG